MPNWVRNKVEFGTPNIIKDCIVKEDGKDAFDFNKIDKMPSEIKKTTSPNGDTPEAREMKKKYGAENWYDWACQHWGTKWNACETEVIDETHVSFDTAWSTPQEIFEKLSEKYHTTIKVEFADECIPENSGTIIYKDGKEVSFKEGDIEFSDYVWGWVDEYNEE